MTKGLDKFFDLPALEDELGDAIDAEDNIEEVEVEVVESTEIAPVEEQGALMTIDEQRSDEHSKAMDAVHDEMIEHARAMTELAFDLDPARAPRMLEVAGSFYKTALDAKISKRDAQLKLMKLMQEQRKIDLQEAKIRHEMGDKPIDKADVIAVVDRNELLNRLREQSKDT